LGRSPANKAVCPKNLIAAFLHAMFAKKSTQNIKKRIMAKKSKTAIIALLVLFSSIGIAFTLASLKKPAEHKTAKSEIVLIPTIEVQNTEIQTVIPILGKITAKQRISIYAEVSGVLKPSKKDFLEGVAYQKGETLLSINSDETYQALIAKRSSLLNLLTQILPELKFDYPKSYDQWYQYLINFDINTKTKKLPRPLNDQEKYFITAKGIFQSYYDILSSEIRLDKYTIKAPFDGTVATSNIKTGGLVMNGQALGSFFNPVVYDLEAEVSLEDIGFISLGDKVKLQDEATLASYEGGLSRISNNIDQQTQSVKVFITIVNKNLKEGQYLKGDILTSNSNLAMEIPRKLIVKNNIVFCVKDSVLQEQPIRIIRNNNNTATVSGLENGMLISGKTKNLHAGLRVGINQ
jgi:multidrug efflux pump subunit AcrA (membrane-fusion protein)